MVRGQSPWLHSESWMEFSMQSLRHFQISYRHLTALLNALIWFSNCPKSQPWAGCSHSGAKGERSSLDSVQKMGKIKPVCWHGLIRIVTAHVLCFGPKLVSSLGLHGIKIKKKKKGIHISQYNISILVRFLYVLRHPHNREKEKSARLIV